MNERRGMRGDGRMVLCERVEKNGNIEIGITIHCEYCGCLRIVQVI